MVKNAIIKLGRFRRLTASLPDDIYVAITEEGLLLVDNEECASTIEEPQEELKETLAQSIMELAEFLPSQPKVPKEIIALSAAKGSKVSCEMIKQFLDVYIGNNLQMSGPCCNTALNNVLFRMTGHNGKETDKLLYSIIEYNKDYINGITGCKA